MPVCKEEMCLYDAPDWRSWGVHVRTHGKIPCTEDGCYASFVNGSNFKRHLKTSHGDAEKYKCSVCPKLYARRDAALRHVVKCRAGGSLTTVGVGGDIVFPVTVIADCGIVTVPMTVSAVHFMVPGSSSASVSGSRVAPTSSSVSAVGPVVSTREVPSALGASSLNLVDSVGVVGMVFLSMFTCCVFLICLFFPLRKICISGERWWCCWWGDRC